MLFRLWNRASRLYGTDSSKLFNRFTRNCSTKEPSDTSITEVINYEKSGDNKVQHFKDFKSEIVSDNKIVFESRLEHYKKLGIKAEVKLINIPDEPKINPFMDTAIDVLRGTSIKDLTPREIVTENSDPRSIQHFPPLNEEVIQKWHEEQPEETTLGFPVIRPPHPLERIKEGFRLKKSSRAEYPYVQDFNHHYDIIILGGGLVGSFIAYYLTERVEVKRGQKIGVVEMDPSYRRSTSVNSVLGLRMQHSLPENVEMSLFGADFIRNIGRKMAIPFDEVSDDDYFNIPNVKYQPHGHLTLAGEAEMQDLERAHEVQKRHGVQSALLTAKQINIRFPWINTKDIVGGCLGLESEGWFDPWNLLQAVKLKNVHQGVDYIHGEVIYCKKHKVNAVSPTSLSMGFYEDGSHVPLGRVFEAHVLLPDSQQVYPIHFSTGIMAGGGATGDMGKMAGIGEGYGVMGVEIPVEKKRGYVFNVNCKTGPGLNCPITSDPSGMFLKRDGLAGNYLIGMLPDGSDIPVNMHGNVDPDYWEQLVLPTLQGRVKNFESPTLLGSHAVDYDYNYFDGSPIIGPHPYVGNMWMACGFNGLGAQMAPAVGRALTELFYDNGYSTIDLSRFAFDRILNSKEVRETRCQMSGR